MGKAKFSDDFKRDAVAAIRPSEPWVNALSSIFMNPGLRMQTD
jgi:hypothetical protein